MNLVVVVVASSSSSSSSSPLSHSKTRQQVVNDVTTDFESNTAGTTNGRWTTKEKSQHNHCEYTDLHHKRKSVHFAGKSVTTQICIANANQSTLPEKDSTFMKGKFSTFQWAWRVSEFKEKRKVAEEKEIDCRRRRRGKGRATRV